MILVIIINVVGETMLQRALGSGWGVLLPGILIAGLAFTDLSVYAWKAVVVLGLLLTSLMPVSYTHLTLPTNLFV